MLYCWFAEKYNCSVCIAPDEGFPQSDQGRKKVLCVRVSRFGRGGISPLHREHEGKTPTQDKAIVEVKPGKTVSIPLMQNIGAPSRAVVKVGQTVKMGELIAEPSGYVSAPIHASVSGKVTAIEDRLHVTGVRLPHIVIENDGQYESKSPLVAYSMAAALALDSALLRKIVQDAGIVGAGGATFPTHVKLNVPENKPIDKLLINGAECEPFITADDRLMVEQGERIADGIVLAMRMLGVKKAEVGIEDNKPKAIAAMEKACGDRDGIEVVSLRTRYPQGSEKHLIQALTGRIVPSGGLPMDVGIVVLNVGTCAAIADALLLGMPMVQRVVTVTGSVNNPQNLLLPVGITFKEAIEACGGYKGEPKKLISGGPMMGVAQADDNVSVVKGTTGILVLNEERVVSQSEYSCIRCGNCVLVCPVGLVPTAIDLWSRNADWDRAEEYLALNCIECGCCSYACPSKRHLVQSIRIAKAEVQQRQRKRAQIEKGTQGGQS
jgi:electron transport complex protein RnfC